MKSIMKQIHDRKLSLKKISMSLLVEGFVLSKQGGRCQNEFGLLTRDQCKLAVETIKKTYPGAKDCVSTDFTWNNRPKGCFYHTLSRCVHWNPAVIGISNGQDVQICSLKNHFVAFQSYFYVGNSPVGGQVRPINVSFWRAYHIF